MGSEFFDINEAASPESPAAMTGVKSPTGNGVVGRGGLEGFGAFGEAVDSPLDGNGYVNTDIIVDNNPFGGMGGMGMNGGGPDDFGLGELTGGLPSEGLRMDGLIPGGAGNENL